MPNMEAITVARIFVNEFTCRFGVPEQLHTDQGRNFESALLKEICKLLGITRTRTTPFTLSQTGWLRGSIAPFSTCWVRLSRMMNTTGTYISPHWWWHTAPVIMRQQELLPFSLVYGREAKLPEDILFNLPSVEETNIHGYAEALKERIQHAYQRVRDHFAIEQKKQKANYDWSKRAYPTCISKSKGPLCDWTKETESKLWLI